jgi:hypothetical protein
MEGKNAEARKALEDALQAAQEIPSQMGRDMNVSRIQNMLKMTEKTTK